MEKAVKGMLPSGRIGRHLFTHLKVRPPPLLCSPSGCKHPDLVLYTHLRVQCASCFLYSPINL